MQLTQVSNPFRQLASLARSLTGKNRIERRKEEGLLNDNNDDSWLEDLNTDHYLEDDFIRALQKGRFTKKINDPKQHEMTFEAAIRRMKELAGLAENFMKPEFQKSFALRPWINKPQ